MCSHRARGPPQLTLRPLTPTHTLLFVTAVPTPWNAPSLCKLVLGQLGQNSRGSQELAILNGLPLAAWLCQGKSSPAAGAQAARLWCQGGWAARLECAEGVWSCCQPVAREEAGEEAMNMLPCVHSARGSVRGLCGAAQGGTETRTQNEWPPWPIDANISVRVNQCP